MPPPALKQLKDIPTVAYLYRTKQFKQATGIDVKPNQDYNNKICTIQYDLTRLQVDAIVNAANRTLLGGGGVDGAIHSAAGPELLEECRKLKGCATGSAKITDAYELPCKKVIHAVGPIFSNEDKSEPLLRGCYRTALQLAVENDCRSVAFSAISTGIYGYPSPKAAKAALREVLKFMNSPDGKKLDKVIFCSFLDKDVNAYAEKIPEVFPPTEEDLSESVPTPLESEQDMVYLQKKEGQAGYKIVRAGKGLRYPESFQKMRQYINESGQGSGATSKEGRVKTKDAPEIVRSQEKIDEAQTHERIDGKSYEAEIGTVENRVAGIDTMAEDTITVHNSSRRASNIDTKQIDQIRPRSPGIQDERGLGRGDREVGSQTSQARATTLNNLQDSSERLKQRAAELISNLAKDFIEQEAMIEGAQEDYQEARLFNERRVEGKQQGLEVEFESTTKQHLDDADFDKPARKKSSWNSSDRSGCEHDWILDNGGGNFNLWPKDRLRCVKCHAVMAYGKHR